MITPDEFTDVTYAVEEDAFAVVTINRPDRMNSFRGRTVDELIYAFKHSWADRRVAAVILTGAGEKAFCAGGDVKERAETGSYGETEWGTFEIERLHRIIRDIPKPVIAAVNGFALGGGCELAMACHLRVASETAKFGQPEVKLGIGPGYGGSVRLPRLVGRGRALELLLTGAMIDAQEAFRIGLVNRIVPADRLIAECEAMMQSILANGPLAVRACLELVDAGSDMSLDEALLLEASYFGLLSATADMREGTTAFLEKRKATFEGR